METNSIKQNQLARLMETTPQNLSKIFNKENLGTEILVKASEALGISLLSFLDDEIQPKETIKGKAKVVLELSANDVLNIDIKNRKLEITKK